MDRGQFTFYRSYFDALKQLPAKSRERILMAIIGYALDGDEPDLSGTEAAVFLLVKPTLDTGRRKAENGKHGGSKRKANGKQTATEKEKEKEIEKEIEIENDSSPQTPRERFVQPTVEEVAQYCQERGNGIDPEHFVDHYKANGWKVGGRAKMKDWRAAVRNWERSGRKDGGGMPF